MSEVSPGEPLPTSDDPEFHSISEDFERQFFAGDKQVRLEVRLMRETWEQLQAMMAEYNWQPNEGLIVLLTTGMAYLRAEHALTVTDGAAGYNEADLRKLLERGITLESRYAAIKNFAFSLMRDHRTLEIKFDPVEREYHAYKTLVTRLREANEALKAENERLRSAMQAAPDVPEGAAITPRKGLWRRMLEALGRYISRR